MSSPRRWFQIHLSTAVVVMLLAALLLYSNFRPEKRERSQEELRTMRGESPVYYGFPVLIARYDYGAFQVNDAGRVLTGVGPRILYWSEAWRVGLNVLFAISTMLATGAVLEYRIRRRKPQT